MSNSYRVLDPGDSCEDMAATLGLLVRDPNSPQPVAGQPVPLQDLAATIESSIIPRLLVSHGVFRAADVAVTGTPVAIDSEMIIAFAEELIALDSTRGLDFVQSLLSRGVAMERILLELMAPAARILGELWSADHCSFMDVTLGVSRIQQILRVIQGKAEGQAGDDVKGRVLLVPSPGEQHTFGLRVVEEFFLRDGWEVRSHLTARHEDVIAFVSDEDFDIVGFSLSAERLMEPLVSVISEIRRKSVNRQIRVMVGGVLFVGRPDLVKQSGTDVYVLDAREAVLQANEWCRSAKVN